MLKNRLKQICFFVVVLLLFYLVFTTGYLVGNRKKIFEPAGITGAEKGKPNGIDFSLFWEAWNKFSEKSVYPVDSRKMIYGSVAGLLSSVDDPYTSFFTPEDNKRFREDIGGEFDGIGIEIISKNGFPTVVAPLSNTPAEKAGVKAGDVILSVDGQKTSDLGFNETISKIRGKKGTSVKLGLARSGKEDIVVLDVVRDTIVVKSVTWERKDFEGRKIFYVKIRQFGDDTNKLFLDFVSETTKLKPDGIIIDLRNNPGGYLESAVDLSSYFLDGGVVLSEKNRSGSSREYKTTQNAKLKGYKTAVLINKGSASASEIFSGALQDRQAGKLIGEKSFGKGSVQELIDLSDGSAVKVTVAKWFTPSGRAINGEGIAPDIEVELIENNGDTQLARAQQYIVTGK